MAIFRGGNFSYWELYMIEIVQGVNCPRLVYSMVGILKDRSFMVGNLSRMGMVRLEIFLDGNCPN